MQGLLQYYIRVAQNQYFNHIREKINTLKMEPSTEALEKIYAFKIKLMQHAITPNFELQCLSDNQQLAALSASASPSFTEANSQVTQQKNSNMPKLKVMIEMREIKQFQKIYLQN